MERFTQALGAYAAHLHDNVIAGYPAMAGTELLGSAMSLLAAIDGADTNSGADDDYAAILSAASATARSSTATTFAVGERHTERALHAWFNDELPREAVAVLSRPVDVWTELSRSVVVTKRTKRGQHREVKRYGRSFVIGRTDGAESELQRPFPLDGMLSAIQRTDGLADGIALAAIATSAYDIPLLGGEHKSWSEVLPADVSARLGAEPYSYSEHTTGPYIGTNERQSVTFPSRHRLTYRARLTDPSDRSVIATRTTKLVSATDRGTVRSVVPAIVLRDDDGRMTYKRAERIAVRTVATERLHDGNVTVQRSKSKSASRYVKPRSYSESFVIREADELAAIVRIAVYLEPDRAVTFANEARTMEGTLTRGKSGRYSGTINGTDVRAKGCRTTQALGKQLAPAFI